MLKHKRLIAATIVIMSVVVIILLLRLCEQDKSPNEEPSTTDSALEFIPASESDDNQIVIPGMTGINLKSGQLKQSVDFYNPEGNPCYFQLQLFLSDNSLIWESEEIAPSERITEITLSQQLDRGIYQNCKLVYNCYSLDDQAILNSAQVILDINAK